MPNETIRLLEAELERTQESRLMAEMTDKYFYTSGRAAGYDDTIRRLKTALAQAVNT